MNILEMATRLQDASEERRRQRDAAALEGFWNEKRLELTGALSGIGHPLDFLRWVSNVDGSPIGVRELAEFRAVTTALSGISKAFAKDPAGLVNSPEFTQAVGKVKALARRLEELGEERWSSLVRKTTWERADLWAPYRGSDEHGDAVEDAVEQDELFDQLSSMDYPTSDHDRNRFLELLKERERLLEVLPPAPAEEVRRFIRDAQNGVPLSDLDESVLNWLREQGLLDSYIVKYHR